MLLDKVWWDFLARDYDGLCLHGRDWTLICYDCDSDLRDWDTDQAYLVRDDICDDVCCWPVGRVAIEYDASLEPPRLSASRARSLGRDRRKQDHGSARCSDWRERRDRWDVPPARKVRRGKQRMIELELALDLDMSESVWWELDDEFDWADDYHDLDQNWLDDDHEPDYGPASWFGDGDY